MDRRWRGALAALVLALAGSLAAAQPGAPEEVALALVDAINRRDAPAVAALFTPNGGIADEETVSGREEILAWAEAQAAQSMLLETLDVRRDSERQVVLRARVTRVDWRQIGIPALTQDHLVEVQGGQIVRLQRRYLTDALRAREEAEAAARGRPAEAASAVPALVAVAAVGVGLSLAAAAWAWRRRGSRGTASRSTSSGLRVRALAEHRQVRTTPPPAGTGVGTPRHE